MMWVRVGVVLALTWLGLGSAAACEADEEPHLIWPAGRGAGVVPPDGVIWLYHWWHGDFTLELVGPEGVHPITRADHPTSGRTVVAVIPDEPLQPGETYELRYVQASHPYTLKILEVAGDGGQEVEPPAPRIRILESEVWYEIDDPCGWAEGDLTYAYSGVSYGLCSTGVLEVAAVGDSEPPEPTVFDLGEAKAELSFEVDGRWSGSGPGAQATVWFGAFSPSGRFSGWRSEAVTLPEASGVRRRDTTPSADLAGSGDVSADDIDNLPPESCPVEDWVMGEEEGGLGPPKEGCGCQVAAPAAGWMAFIPLLAVARRRRGLGPR